MKILNLTNSAIGYRLSAIGYRLSAIGAAAVLVACGGGGSSLTISGMAATGAALGDAVVSVKCAGNSGAGTTTGDGTFSVVMEGATAPCIVQVTKGTLVLHSFSQGGERINVTPITDLIVTKAAGSDPFTAFNSFDEKRGAEVLAALSAAKTYVIDQVTPLLGGLPTGDPLTTTFKVGDATDKLLDNLQASLAAAGKGQADLRTATGAGKALTEALPPEEARLHDKIPYAVNASDASATTFAAMTAVSGDAVDMSTTSRWQGVQGGAVYRVEVPANWNGELVMYAHGYAGEDTVLSANNSSIRRFLIQNGYAWAASSYSKKSYDVKAGIEDTNALALAFNTIATARGRTLAKPSKTYIIGHSMGGHIAAAAVEAETYATSKNKLKYDGSMPMCGVVGDTELFNTISAMQLSAQTLGGYPKTGIADWNKNNGAIKTAVTKALFAGDFATAQPVQPNGAKGAAYYSVLQNLTGGKRPLVDLGYAYGGSFRAGPYTFFGIDSVTLGLTTQLGTDTTGITYAIDGDATASAELNAATTKITGAADFNRLRRDGLRWIPKVNGQIMAPVLSLHTLGDLFVPFSMQQFYKKRAVANGSDQWLVQRAIRGVSHCDFTNAEMTKGFIDLVKWVKQGSKPAGDDVTTATVLAADSYGCAHTNDTLDADDEANTRALRGVVAQAGKTCAR